ncbi:MAG TPA: hypothetical protein VK251_11465 [Steroidobacteraceae bacterium]|nr:hypothetical protein [Steroidobacteraceae bacterium]
MPPRSWSADAYVYKPPSMLAQYKGLAIVFAIVCVALTLYCFMAPHGTRYSPPPKQPIYVDAVPQ